MMELFVILVGSVATFILGYVIGFGRGLGKNIILELSQFPLNVTVQTENGILYAYNMMTEGFIGQSPNMDGLIAVIREKHPEQTIVFSHANTEVDK